MDATTDRLTRLSDDDLVTDATADLLLSVQRGLDDAAITADGHLADDRMALRAVALAWWRRRTLNAAAPETGAIVGWLAAVSGPDDPGLPPEAAGLLTRFADRPEIAAARPIRQAELGARLMQDALAVEDHAKLDIAVAALREAAGALPPGRHRTGALHNLGIALRERYSRRQRDEDITASISAHGEAVDGTGPDDPALAGRLAMLGHAWQERYDWTGDRESLDAAIGAHHAALVRAAQAHPDGRAITLAYAGSLRERATQDGDATRLAEIAIVLRTLAASGGPAEEAAAIRSAAATTAMTRYQLTGDPGDITAAVDALYEAIDLAEAVNARATYRGNLGSALLTRYVATGVPDDLTGAAEQLTMSIEADADDLETLLRRGTLALVWLRQFERGDDADLLAEAIRTVRTVLGRLPAGQPDRPGVLANLAILLFTRYERHGEPDDLESAVGHAREAVRLTPEEHPHRPGRVANLAAALRTRYLLRPRMADLDEAVRHLRPVTGRPNAESATCAAALGSTLLLRADFGSDDRERDLDEAVRVLGAVAATGPGTRPDRAGYAAEHGRALLARQSARREDGRAAEADDDLATAVEVLDQAAGLLPVGHPTRASCLVNLAVAHRATYRASGTEAALERALRIYADARTEPGGIARVRYQAAVSGGRLAMEQDRLPEALAAFEAAVALLPRLAWQGLQRGQQESILAAEGAVVADAAVVSIRSGRPDLALQLLEQGRSVLWAHQRRSQDDLRALRAAHPRLAERLSRVIAELDTEVSRLRDTAAEGVPVAAPDADRRIALNEQLGSLLAEIHADSRFAGFWDLPAPDRLRDAAAEGPVALPVVSLYGAYALVVQDDVPVLPVPLDGLRTEDLAKHSLRYAAALTSVRSADPARRRTAAKHLDSVLAWLWRTVAGPVLKALGLAPVERQHVRLWWCPTGLLAMLPLHAAQHFDEDSLTDVGVPDHVISSYTPTLRDLLAARERPAEPITGALAVALRRTPGQDELRHVPPEITAIRDVLPVPLEVIEDGEATLARVGALLPSVQWLHFAGHSRWDLHTPGDSCLVLADGNLTVTKIGTLRMPRAQLAFLASCESSAGSPSLPDEAIHLAGALLVAGCSHVISTRWALPDAAAATMTELVYRALRGAGDRLDASGAARALHEALRPARGARPSVHWASFCHTGR